MKTEEIKQYLKANNRLPLPGSEVYVTPLKVRGVILDIVSSPASEPDYYYKVEVAGKIWIYHRRNILPVP